MDERSRPIHPAERFWNIRESIRASCRLPFVRNLSLEVLKIGPLEMPADAQTAWGRQSLPVNASSRNKPEIGIIDGPVQIIVEASGFRRVG